MMTDLKHWNEVTRGIYRYVIAASVAYELHINYWNCSNDIMNANASLFLVGDWQDEDNTRFFERETLLDGKSVAECLATAKKDYRENIS